MPYGIAGTYEKDGNAGDQLEGGAYHDGKQGVGSDFKRLLCLVIVHVFTNERSDEGAENETKRSIEQTDKQTDGGTPYRLLASSDLIGEPPWDYEIEYGDSQNQEEHEHGENDNDGIWRSDAA